MSRGSQENSGPTSRVTRRNVLCYHSNEMFVGHGGGRPVLGIGEQAAPRHVRYFLNRARKP